MYSGFTENTICLHVYMADMCNIYTQKLEAHWRKKSRWWLLDSVTALTIHLYFNSFLTGRWKRRFGFVSVSQKKGEEDASFPSSHLTVLVVYGLLNSSGEMQLNFSRPKPCSCSSLWTAGSAPSVPPQTACLNEERMDICKIPASKVSYVCKSTQVLPCIKRGF